MILKCAQDFRNYSDGAKQQVIDQAVGRPFMNLEGRSIGTIVSAEIMDNRPNLIMFNVEVKDGDL